MSNETTPIPQEIMDQIDTAAFEHAKIFDSAYREYSENDFHEGAEFGYHLSPPAAPSAGTWVRASEQSPVKAGYYHTNLGWTEWGSVQGECFWFNRTGGYVDRWLDETAVRQASAGTRYPIPVKICNSCGGPVSNDPFERVIHEEGGYEYYFCEKCCDQNKHFKITLPSPPTAGSVEQSPK